MSTDGAADVVTITYSDFAISADGAGQFFKPGSLERSAAKWFTFTPAAFSISSQVPVQGTLTIRVPSEPALHGTYWAAAFVNSSPRASTGGQANVAVAGRVAVAVYVNVGPGTQKAQAGNMKFDATTRTVSYVFQNQGDTLLRPATTLALVGADGKRFANLDLDDFPVLPGGVHNGTYRIPDSVQLPAGQFLAVLTFAYGDHKLIAAQGTFKGK
ncbi:MAG TPA: hypothetical protein VHN99_00535 [Deinococcales bacterium]|nr:hypothetical protein [Deinococcales bacterium]